MIDKQMKILFEQNKKRDEENPKEIEGMWNKEIKVLTSSLPDTIDYLKKASPEELFYVAEVFDDVSEYWQSPELVSVMEDAVSRCPDRIRNVIQVDIKYAKEALKK